MSIIIRPSFDETYTAIASAIALRSVDPSTKVGGVAVNASNELIGASYNGFKAGYNPEFDISKERDKKLLLIIHAEENLLVRHKKGEIAKFYCTHSPCRQCAKLIGIWGVKEFIYLNDYPDQEFRFIFREYGVKFRKFE